VPEKPAESLNVYDRSGRVVGTRPRAEAGDLGLAVGAVNLLLVNAAGEVLLQKRRPDKENGGRWDKSVGGHVDAGEDFDTTVVREAGEELFGDPRSARVRLVEASGPLAGAGVDLSRDVVFRRAGVHLNLRDVRHAPQGGLRNVIYHVAAYLGRTDVPVGDLRPDHTEIDAFRYASPSEVDEMLVRGALAPNLAFLWLIHARELLDLAGGA